LGAQATRRVCPFLLIFSAFFLAFSAPPDETLKRALKRWKGMGHVRQN
jgi:hypothetical protein